MRRLLLLVSVLMLILCIKFSTEVFAKGGEEGEVPPANLDIDFNRLAVRKTNNTALSSIVITVFPDGSYVNIKGDNGIQYPDTTLKSSISSTSVGKDALYLYNDGSIEYTGQGLPPSLINDVIKIDSSCNENLEELCALLTGSGVVEVFGYEDTPENHSLYAVPSSATNIVDIAVGIDYVLAVRDDGKVIIWGDTTKLNEIIIDENNVLLSANNHMIENIIKVEAHDDYGFATYNDGIIRPIGWFDDDNTHPTRIGYYFSNNGINIDNLVLGKNFSGVIDGQGVLHIFGNYSQELVDSIDTEVFTVTETTLNTNILILEYKNGDSIEEVALGEDYAVIRSMDGRYDLLSGVGNENLDFTNDIDIRLIGDRVIYLPKSSWFTSIEDPGIDIVNNDLNIEYSQYLKTSDYPGSMLPGIYEITYSCLDESINRYVVASPHLNYNVVMGLSKDGGTYIADNAYSFGNMPNNFDENLPLKDLAFGRYDYDDYTYKEYGIAIKEDNTLVGFGEIDNYQIDTLALEPWDIPSKVFAGGEYFAVKTTEYKLVVKNIADETKNTYYDVLDFYSYGDEYIVVNNEGSIIHSKSGTSSEVNAFENEISNLNVVDVAISEDLYALITENEELMIFLRDTEAFATKSDFELLSQDAFFKVEAGNNHIVVLKKDGTIYTFDIDDITGSDQISDNWKTNMGDSIPSDIYDYGSIIDITVTGDTTMAVTTYGKAVVWGDNNTDKVKNVPSDIRLPIDITYIGGQYNDLNIGESYIEQGITAGNSILGDISPDIIVQGTVDSDVVEIYYIDYFYNGIKIGTKTVSVGSTSQGYQMKLFGDKVMTLKQGKAYEEPGYGLYEVSTQDKVNTTIDVSPSSIDTTKIGETDITYTADIGEIYTNTRKVKVIPDVIITLEEGSDIAIYEGEEIIQNISIFDNFLNSNVDEKDFTVVKSYQNEDPTTVDVKEIRNYTFNISYKGISFEITQRVKILKKPLISIIGDELVYAIQNQPYVDEGAEVFDICGNKMYVDISDDSINVDTTILGDYIVEYTANAMGIDISTTRTVRVIRDVEFSLIGDNEINLYEDQLDEATTYTLIDKSTANEVPRDEYEFVISVVDDYSPTISDEIEYFKDYTLAVEYPKNSNRVYTLKRKVNILKEGYLILNGEGTLWLRTGDNYIEEGVKYINRGVIDNTADISVSGNVDTTKEGLYELVYSHNGTKAKRIVSVYENKKVKTLNDVVMVLENGNISVNTTLYYFNDIPDSYNGRIVDFSLDINGAFLLRDDGKLYSTRVKEEFEIDGVIKILCSSSNDYYNYILTDQGEAYGFYNFYEFTKRLLYSEIKDIFIAKSRGFGLKYDNTVLLLPGYQGKGQFSGEDEIIELTSVKKISMYDDKPIVLFNDNTAKIIGETADLSGYSNVTDVLALKDYSYLLINDGQLVEINAGSNLTNYIQVAEKKYGLINSDLQSLFYDVTGDIIIVNRNNGKIIPLASEAKIANIQRDLIGGYEFSLTGGNVVIELGEEYQEAGAVAFDYENNIDDSTSVVVEGSPFNLGENEITYTYNSGTLKRKVFVKGNLDNVVAGDHFTAILNGDKTVSASGLISKNNSFPYTPFGVPEFENVIKIAAGDNHLAVLFENGTICVYGRNDFSQQSVPSDINNAVDIYADCNTTLVVLDNGEVRAFGGHAGNGDTEFANAINTHFYISDLNENYKFGMQADEVFIYFPELKTGSLVEIDNSNNVSISDNFYAETYEVLIEVRTVYRDGYGYVSIFDYSAIREPNKSNKVYRTNYLCPPYYAFKKSSSNIDVSASSRAIIALKEDGTIAVLSSDVEDCYLKEMNNIVAVKTDGNSMFVKDDNGIIHQWGYYFDDEKLSNMNTHIVFSPLTYTIDGKLSATEIYNRSPIINVMFGHGDYKIKYADGERKEGYFKTNGIEIQNGHKFTNLEVGRHSLYIQDKERNTILVHFDIKEVE